MQHASLCTHIYMHVHMHVCLTHTCDAVQGCQLCSMCGENTTNLEDGSSSCPVPFIAGSSPSYRYAVIVSFGVLLNGTALDDIASKVLRRACVVSDERRAHKHSTCPSLHLLSPALLKQIGHWCLPGICLMRMRCGNTCARLFCQS